VSVEQIVHKPVIVLMWLLPGKNEAAGGRVGVKESRLIHSFVRRLLVVIAYILLSPLCVRRRAS